VTRETHPKTFDLQDPKFFCQRLLAMKPGEFEEIISQLLAGTDCEMVEVTKLSGDGDNQVQSTLGVGVVVHIKMAVQKNTPYAVPNSLKSDARMSGAFRAPSCARR
jgi:hypothetical protein